MDIERVQGKCEIVIKEGGGGVRRHLLDQGVIEFKTAVEDKDLGRWVVKCAQMRIYTFCLFPINKFIECFFYYFYFINTKFVNIFL